MTDDKCSTTSKSGLVEKIDQESGREGTCWPREWLAADLPQTRLLTVKYKVYIVLNDKDVDFFSIKDNQGILYITCLIVLCIVVMNQLPA